MRLLITCGCTCPEGLDLSSFYPQAALSFTIFVLLSSDSSSSCHDVPLELLFAFSLSPMPQIAHFYIYCFSAAQSMSVHFHISKLLLSLLITLLPVCAFSHFKILLLLFITLHVSAFAWKVVICLHFPTHCCCQSKIYSCKENIVKGKTNRCVLGFSLNKCIAMLQQSGSNI